MKKKIILLLYIFFLSINVFSQENVNQDSLFISARKLAFEKKYNQAKIILNKIIDFNPQNIDALLLLGNINAWNKNHNIANQKYKLILKQDPNNIECIFSIINNNKWAKKIDSAIYYCNYGLKRHPANSKLLLLTLELYVLNEDKKNAFQIAEKLKNIPYEIEKVELLLQELRQKTAKNSIFISNLTNYFKTPYKKITNITTIGYGHVFKHAVIDFQTNIINLNINGQRDSLNPGFQYEVDFYPIFKKNLYMNLNYASSQSGLFPNKRAAIEVYKGFGSGWEASLGYRYMFFVSSIENIEVNILTASITHYFNNYMITFRSYLIKPETKLQSSNVLTIRKYFSSKYNYFDLQLFYGNSPDFPENNINNPDIYNYKSYKIRGEYNASLKNNLYYKIGISVGAFEYNSNEYRGEADLFLRLAYRF